ncbi:MULTISPECIES: hypothetical protein [Roseomonadaceae]|uniref:Flagellar hook-length control protein FliK n=1 Tax=Falsiroseomonas oleicola TaxID=2801474 RepID=A0ABS6H7T9_9PROT|nr:hypothetical protein [Roseomonas oleicola]MBU8543867.1 hypothetical protein [Roseomonas oleicola]
MELSGSGGAISAALLQQMRDRRLPREEDPAANAASASAGLAQSPAGITAGAVPESDPDDAVASSAGQPQASLSAAMLNVLFSAQADDGNVTAEANPDVAARLTAMLQRALTAYAPEDEVASGRGVSQGA